MSELVDWLRAQLDEDERVARQAMPGPWRWVDPGGRVKQALVSGEWSPITNWTIVVPVHNADVYPSRYDAAHIARWDPARVLAEVDAKRELIAAYLEARAEAEGYHGQLTDPDAVEEVEAGMWGEVAALEYAVACAALPYADLPGYRDEWRPDGQVD